MEYGYRKTPRFGDVFVAVLDGAGNVQNGRRPVVIAQNNIGNTYSNTVEVIPMSSRVEKASHLPTHIIIEANKKNGLNCQSVVLAEQTTTINKSCLISRLGYLSKEDLTNIGKARAIQSPFPTAC